PQYLAQRVVQHLVFKMLEHLAHHDAVELAVTERDFLRIPGPRPIPQSELAAQALNGALIGIKAPDVDTLLQREAFESTVPDTDVQHGRPRPQIADHVPLPDF